MRRMSCLAVVLTAASMLAVVPTGSAHALGGEWLGCKVFPGPAVYRQHCTTNYAANSYTIWFGVQNQSGSYSYAWTIDSNTSVTIVDGCTATTSYCKVAPAQGVQEATVVAYVQLTQGGQSVQLYSSAYIPSFCGPYVC